MRRKTKNFPINLVSVLHNTYRTQSVKQVVFPKQTLKKRSKMTHFMMIFLSGLCKFSLTHASGTGLEPEQNLVFWVSAASLYHQLCSSRHFPDLPASSHCWRKSLVYKFYLLKTFSFLPFTGQKKNLYIICVPHGSLSKHLLSLYTLFLWLLQLSIMI